MYDTACCITMFNEDSEHLKNTLESFSLSFSYAQKQQFSCLGSVDIYVYLDGKHHADKTIIEMLDTHGVSKTENKDQSIYHFDIHDECVKSVLDVSVDIEANLIFILKSQNLGKLDSINQFYTQFSANYDFIFQIDTGSMSSKLAVFKMIDLIHKNENVAAVACSIEMDASSTLLNAWQSVDCLVYTSIFMRLDYFSDSIDVVPGCFSLYRVSHILPYIKKGLYSAEKSELPSNWLSKKLQSSAEDRLLVSWLHLDGKISYSKDAKVAVDVCDSFNELLLQRKRWFAGVLVSQIKNFQRYFFHNDLSKNILLSSKALFEILWLSLLPFITLLVAAYMGIYAESLGKPVNIYVEILSYAGQALWFAMLILALLRKHRLFSVCIILMLMGTLFIAPMLIAHTLSHSDPIAVYLSIATALLILANVERSKKFTLYALSNHAIRSCISLYSWVNLFDDSWGTKGKSQQSTPNSSHIDQYCRVAITIALALGALFVVIYPRSALIGMLTIYVIYFFIVAINIGFYGLRSVMHKYKPNTFVISRMASYIEKVFR